MLAQGPQPVEAMISTVCHAFQCPPDVSLRQDFALVVAILDYRTAMAAKEQHNSDATKMTEDQVRIWQTMAEAMIDQQGKV